MAGRKNVLSELQAQKIRENYKPGDRITKIAEKISSTLQDYQEHTR